MAFDIPPPGSLKRKRRRRREDKPALSARIYLDSGLKGEAGVLSEDLVQDLFPQGIPQLDKNGKQPQIYIAVAPWTPNPNLLESNWVVLPINPVRPWNDKPLPTSTIRFPASALSTQSFVRAVQAASPNRTLRQNAAVEVRVSDVVPLPLETVFVSIDTEALQKLEDVQKRYGAGFAGANGHVGRRQEKKLSPDDEDKQAAEKEQRRRTLVEQALQTKSVIHTGDLIPLPSTHPVTHAPAPPAKVLACEPVSQGMLNATTKIVLVPTSDRQHNNAGNRALLSPRLPEETEDEDTANEAFFSATESPAKLIVTSKSATDMSNSDDLFDSSAEDSNLSSDEDDMISLAKPGLTDQPSGMSSALTSATPRPFGSRFGGISTPGSVYSHISASTIRGSNAPRSKVFRAQGLLEAIPDEMLHPKPGSEEDEEARVFVDATALARLGCFSGDWIKVEASSQNQLLPGFGAFGGFEELETQNWRPAKVYGLPENMSKRPQRYQVNNTRHSRRDSISSLVTNSAAVATAYLSPILLANLDSPTNISVSPLSPKRATAKRPGTARPASTDPLTPPIATEMTLRKVVTPVSSERALNSMLFTNLKEHLERKQRIVKGGDLIAVPIDQSLGRSLYEGEVEQDGADSVNAIYKWSATGQQDKEQNHGSLGVAWFTVEAVKTSPSNDHEADSTNDIWGGAASIDPSATSVRQSGDDKRKIPSASSNPWQYYLGVRRINQRSVGGSNGLPEAPQPYISPLQRRLRELVSVSISPRAIHLGMPPLAVLLTSTQRSIGKAYTVQQVCADLGMHYFAIDAFDISSEGGSGVDTQTQGLLEARCERALECGGEATAICIKHIEMLNSDRIAGSLKDVLERARVLVATTTDIDKLPDTVRGLFTHELEMGAPDEGEREGILRDILAQSGTPVAPDVDLASIAVKTAALVAGDLIDVVERAVVARTERLESLAASASSQTGQPVTFKDIQLSGAPGGAQALTLADFESAVELARKNFADSIGAPKIPNVQWSDVGGLAHVKDAVVETIQLPLSRPELFAKGLKKRSGILFYGPPGTGKTLLAKAIATEFSLNFFSVKGPELLNMYIGESEANVRRVFQRARDARPCVVFFDELDSVAPKRGNQGDSGGVMDRIVSQLLAELDGMSDGEEGGGGVFVIGATNRPDLLDQALLRPGRFDKMLYLGISDTHEKQATILQALTRKFTLSPDLSLPRVASTLPFTFTGADLYALCSDAMLKAVTRSARAIDARVAALNSQRTTRGQTPISIVYFFDHFAQEQDLGVQVEERDFDAARKELIPSVSMEELGHYERVRDSFEGKKTGKDETAMRRDEELKEESENAAKLRMMDMMSRMAVAGKGKVPATNGSSGVGSHGGSRSGPTSDVKDAEDGDDDFVIRTDGLAVNGGGGSSVSMARPQSSKGKLGKGKGKGAVVDVHDEQGEDLYD